MRRWIYRILFVSSALLLCAIVAGFVYQSVEDAEDKRLYHPPGQLIDIGGYHLHLYCVGEGSPAVILHWPYFLSWYAVQPEIAKFTRACTVDSAGIGWSDSGPSPRDADQVSKELNLVLTRGNVSPPYILIGHSRGAFYLRVYATRFHNDVAGMVLVDPEHEDTLKRIPEFSLSPTVRAELRLGPLLTRIGFVRLAGLCGARNWVEGSGQAIPPEIEKMSVAVECRTSFVQSEADYQWALEPSAEEARISGTLGNIPLVVISRDPSYYPSRDNESSKASDIRVEEIWADLQREQLKLSSNSKQIIAKGAGHGVPSQRPDVIIDAVQSLVQNWRLASSENKSMR